MTRIALIGAGGNIGGRVRRSLRGETAYELRCYEAFEQAHARVRETGHEPYPLEEALDGAEIVVLSVADHVAGPVSAEIVPKMDSGSTLLCMDPAAPHAERIPKREDIACVVSHPTHPPLFDLLEEDDLPARQDYWGGGLARQSLVSALVWGPEEKFAPAEALAARIFQPIMRTFRVTLDQLALLEPGMSETVAATCTTIMREAMDEVIARGVEPQAARDFMLGHIQIELALLFDALDWRLSEGAQKAVEEARPMLFQPDWKRVLSPEEIRASTDRITTPRS